MGRAHSSCWPVCRIGSEYCRRWQSLIVILHAFSRAELSDGSKHCITPSLTAVVEVRMCSYYVLHTRYAHKVLYALLRTHLCVVPRLGNEQRRAICQVCSEESWLLLRAFGNWYGMEWHGVYSAAVKGSFFFPVDSRYHLVNGTCFRNGLERIRLFEILKIVPQGSLEQRDLIVLLLQLTDEDETHPRPERSQLLVAGPAVE